MYNNYYLGKSPSLDTYSKGPDTFVYVGVVAAVTGIIISAITTVLCGLSKRNRSKLNVRQ